MRWTYLVSKAMGKVNGKVAGALIFIGVAQFILNMLIAECLYPNYSVSENYISDLGRLSASSAPVFNSSIVILGLTVIAGAYFLREVVRSKAFLSLLILCGVGVVGVGIFPEDFGVIHFIASLTAFLFGALSAIASYRFQRPPLSYFAVVLGVISLAALILFGLGVHLGLNKGGMERMIAYPILLWALGFSGYLIKE